jgi:SWI/SNF-related matrix-associated actin-dependent regulator of chromatin subfamily A3
MIERENPKSPNTVSDPAVQFWVREANSQGKLHWLNVATRSPQAETPELGRGGIIADGMGLGVYCADHADLGKTLTTLALTLATKSDELAPGESKCTLIGESILDELIQSALFPSSATGRSS